jgi:hypothetical protein
MGNLLVKKSDREFSLSESLMIWYQPALHKGKMARRRSVRGTDADDYSRRPGPAGTKTGGGPQTVPAGTVRGVQISRQRRNTPFPHRIWGRPIHRAGRQRRFRGPRRFHNLLRRDRRHIRRDIPFSAWQFLLKKVPLFFPAISMGNRWELSVLLRYIFFSGPTRGRNGLIGKIILLCGNPKPDLEVEPTAQSAGLLRTGRNGPGLNNYS